MIKCCIAYECIQGTSVVVMAANCVIMYWLARQDGLSLIDDGEGGCMCRMSARHTEQEKTYVHCDNCMLVAG
jgi:hypothetical protein